MLYIHLHTYILHYYGYVRLCVHFISDMQRLEIRRLSALFVSKSSEKRDSFFNLFRAGEIK